MDTYFPDNEKSRQNVQTRLIKKMYALKRKKQKKEMCPMASVNSVLYKDKSEKAEANTKKKRERLNYYEVLEDPDTFVLRSTRKNEPPIGDTNKIRNTPAPPAVKETEEIKMCGNEAGYATSASASATRHPKVFGSWRF